MIADASGESLRRTLEGGAYLIKPNMREFSELLGKKIHDEADLEAAAQSLAVGTAFARPSEGEPPSAAAVGAQAVGRLLLAYVPFGIWPAKAQEELRTALVTRQDGRWADAPLHAFAMAPHAALLPVVEATAPG